VYSQVVVFREIKDIVKHEVLPREKELENMEFELKVDELESIVEKELEGEEKQHTLVLSRSVQERRKL